MGVCKSSTKQEKKIVLLQESIKQIEIPSKSVTLPQQRSVQFVSKPNISKTKSTPSIGLKRPAPSPVKPLTKNIVVLYIPFGQKYSIINSPNLPKSNISYTLVQSNSGGQIRRLRNLKTNEKNNAFVKWLIDTELSNPHICQVVEIFKEKSSILLIEEYCSDGQLTQMIQKGPIQENVCAIIVEQILQIIQYLQGKGLVHGSLKLSSFGLQNTSLDFFVKLIENRNIFEKKKITVQDIPYLAPEMLINSTSVALMPGDMWSVGIITYQLLIGKSPFDVQNMEFQDAKKEVIEMQQELNLLKTQLSKGCLDFLESLLKIDPEERVSVDAALESTWISSTRQINNKYLKPLYNLSKAKPVTYFQQCILIKMIETFQKEVQCSLKQLFDSINQRKDGILNKAEITNLYQKVYNNESVSKDVDLVFANLDTDGNNGINFQEFLIATVDKTSLLEDQQLEETFKLVSNISGFITVKSLVRIIQCDEEFLKQEFRQLYPEKINKKMYLEIFQGLKI